MKSEIPNSNGYRETKEEHENLEIILGKIPIKCLDYVEYDKQLVYGNGFFVEEKPSGVLQNVGQNFICMDSTLLKMLIKNRPELLNNYDPYHNMHFLPMVEGQTFNGLVSSPERQLTQEQKNRVKLDFCLGLLKFLENVQLLENTWLKAQTNSKFLSFLVSKFGFIPQEKSTNGFAQILTLKNKIKDIKTYSTSLLQRLI